ncbi:MAG TPA: hypothetical protein VMR41_05555 [Patescibacteria group bacterium]|nr:hypothetical protein [Patescibacteria group bacterium]
MGKNKIIDYLQKTVLSLIFLLLLFVSVGKINLAHAYLRDVLTSQTNGGWGTTYTMGYRFTPTSSGTITQLWCYSGTTSTVTLWSEAGTSLASTSINCTSGWVSGNITPVAVTAGTYYRVTAWGANYYGSISFPYTTTGITLDSSCYVAGSNAFPTCGTGWPVYGLVDVTLATGGSSTQTFTASNTGQSGSIQTWTVPSTGTYTIDAYGAQGGSGSGAGGYGARIKGDFSLTGGTQLKILVGQQGVSGTHQGGGGGGTFVTNSSNSPYIIAGGGGGGYNSSSSWGATTYMPGATGTSGNPGIYGYGSTTGGAGGTSGNGGGCSPQYPGASEGAGGGGLNGDGSTCSGTGGTNYGGKSFVNGGAGGTSNSAGSSAGSGGYGGGGAGEYYYYTGGGGGGGYSGGGGGTYWGGGGGGGSYNGGTNQTNTAGYQSGNGQVIITYASAPTPSPTPTSVPVTLNSTYELQGFYSTDADFIVGGQSSAASPAPTANFSGFTNCSSSPDYQLGIAGSIVVNAAHKGGVFSQQRNLCSSNALAPAVAFTQRPDFLLNFPSLFGINNYHYTEVAP